MKRRNQSRVVSVAGAVVMVAGMFMDPAVRLLGYWEVFGPAWGIIWPFVGAGIGIAAGGFWTENQAGKWDDEHDSTDEHG